MTPNKLGNYRRTFNLCTVMLVAMALAGCGRLNLMLARGLEKSGNYEKALIAYLSIADRTRGSSLAPEALYAAGRLAGGTLLDYELARKSFQDVLDHYGDRPPWPQKAERALFNTPNYFPLAVNGQWEEGDSETGGKNARIKVVCRPVETDPWAVLIVNNYYAGDKFLKDLSSSRMYKKEGLELREVSGGKSSTVILKYPFLTGAHWTSRRGNSTASFSIEGFQTVHVAAGEFKDCLVVREQPEGVASSWKRNYYAPGVGRVLTSIATANSEKRNTELLSFSLANGYERGEEPGSWWPFKKKEKT